MVKLFAKPAQPQTDVAGCWGIVVLVLIVVGIGSLSKCSSTEDNGATTNAASLMDTNISAGVAAQAPPSVEPLNVASVTRGTAHFRLAYRVEGWPGAMIYSQNCYDALTHKFSWAKLDTCGAFDMLAVRAIGGADVIGFDGEADYFESETAAGRYLAAATGGGEDATEADRRLSDLQAKTARAPSHVPAAKTVESEGESDNTSTTNIVSPAEAENTAEPLETEDSDV
jgi:hypothetical protein